ncbi:MAG: hypothetical protein WBF09_08925 [Candidatus Acidiferrum sp.]
MFRDDEFDVYVTEDALAIVHRGDHLASAQTFGADWDGPTHSAVYATVFDAPKSGEPVAVPRNPRGYVLRCLLSCVFADPAAWVCAGAALAWFVWLAWK